MEKKERYYYKKILRDCIMPEGLYEIKDRKCNKWFLIIEDKRNVDKITKKLNQYDKRIKELEDLVIEYKNKLYRRLDQVDNLIKENQQLKQQLHDLPKKIVEEIRNGFNEKIKDNGFNSSYGIDLFWLNNFLDTILKKYGGENE